MYFLVIPSVVTEITMYFLGISIFFWKNQEGNM